MKSYEIVINARFLTQKLTGVQRYAIEISKSLKQLKPKIKFLAPRNILHVDVAKELGIEVIGNSTGYFWGQIELPLYLKSIGSPLLFNPANMAPIFYRNKIVSLHDIAFVKYPSGFDWRFRFVYKVLIPIILKTSNKIITVSQFSKKEIIDYYALSTDKIAVINGGIDEKFHTSLNKHTEKEYFLGVSSLDARKNFKGLIEAFLKLNHPSIKLYIIGDKNNAFKHIDVITDERIKFLGRVTDEELISYYSGALAFIYPSFYEGFGLPLLEAMACGTPVITSNLSSMPEVCGDAAMYVDPYDVEDIANKLQIVLEDEVLQRVLIDKGLIHVQKFSWEKASTEHLVVFNKVLNQ